MRKFNTILIANLLIISLSLKAQTDVKQIMLDKLCRKWIVDSIEVNDLPQKFAPPENIKNNFCEYRKDGSFKGRDREMEIEGKWKMDFEKMQLINYHIKNSQIDSEVVFNIIEISDNRLAITSNQMSGNQVTMYYKPAKD